MYHTQ